MRCRKGANLRVMLREMSKPMLSENGQVVCLAIAASAASIAVGTLGADQKRDTALGFTLMVFAIPVNSSAAKEGKVGLAATLWAIVNPHHGRVGCCRASTANPQIRPAPRRNQNDGFKLLPALAEDLFRTPSEVIRRCWIGLANWSWRLLLRAIRRLLHRRCRFGVGRERHVPFTSNFRF